MTTPDTSGVRDFLVPDPAKVCWTQRSPSGWFRLTTSELNQPLCTVETNKAEVEILSPYAGRIVALGGFEGETLPVGSCWHRIDTGTPAGDYRCAGRPFRNACRSWSATARTNDGHQPSVARRTEGAASWRPIWVSIWRTFSTSDHQRDHHPPGRSGGGEAWHGPGPRCAVADYGANVVGAQHCSRCPRVYAG